MPDPVEKPPMANQLHKEASPALPATNATVVVESEQPVAIRHDHDREDMSVFFGIGIVVNLTMFTALVVWGVSQWRKSDARKK